MPFPVPTPIKTRIEFQNETAGKQRGGDRILLNIDQLLDGFHQSREGPQQMAYLGKLLLTADKWLRVPPRNDLFTRYGNVEQFRASLLKRLMEETRLPEGGVRPWLEKTFGAFVSEPMAEQDRTTKATYYTAAEAEKYRLKFTNGAVWAQRWWENSLGLTRFDTEDHIRSLPVAMTGRGDGDTQPGFANYVLTIDGEFYSTFHRTGNKGRFHSAYTGGKPVHCAGEIKVTDGVVFHINNRSGHYTPGLYKLRDAVETLQLRGVDMAHLRVTVFEMKSEGNFVGTQFSGREFLEAFPPRYIVAGNEPVQVVLNRRASGIQDVVLTPMYRDLPPNVSRRNFVAPDNYPKILSTIERLVAEELTAQAELAKLRIVPLRPAIKSTLNFNDHNATPGIDDVRGWGADLVLVPQLFFDLNTAELPRLAINYLVVSKKLNKDQEVEEYTGGDVTKNPAPFLLKIGPLARRVIQGLATEKD